MNIRTIFISLFFSLLTPTRSLAGPLFPQDTIYACGTSYTLTVPSGLTNYQWNTGATTSSITVTRSSWYSCSAIQNGTTVRDSVFLNLLYVHIINNDTAICPNTTVTLYAQDLFNFSCTGYPSQNYSTWTNIAPLGIIYKCNGLYYIRTATDVLVGNSINGPWTPLNLPGGLLAGPTELLGVDATGRLHVGTANNGNYVYNGTAWTSTGLTGFATGGQFFTLLSNGRIIITKTGSLVGIYYSNDNGNTWQQSNAPAGTWLFITASDNGNLFAVGAGGAIRSTDGGLTWTLINNQLGGITSATGVTKDCNGILWMAAGRTFYRSNDNGVTWVPVGPIPSIFTNDPAGGTLLATSNGEIYYFGFSTTLPIVQGLFVTKDGGLSWTQVTSFPGTLSFLKEIDGQLIACTNTGVYALTLQPTLSYLWSTGATTPVTTVTPAQSTTYYVTVSNGISSCSDSIRITVNRINNLTAGNDTIICTDSTITLASNGLSGFWSATGNNSGHVFF
jgi:hypothetical protein